MKDRAKHSIELLAIARLFHPRLQKVGRAVGQCIGEMDGNPASYFEFYWLQTAPLHQISPADPIGQGLWAEAFGEGYAQGTARRRLAMQEGELQLGNERQRGVSDV